MSLRKKRTSYEILANRLREKILSGGFEPGSRLPTEFELCEKFGASRITVRRSLEILAEEMLIERRQGSGTYVSQRPSRRIPLLDADFSGSVRRHAPELRRTLVESDERAIEAEIATKLSVPAGTQVLYARRVDSVGSNPVAYDDLYIPLPFSTHLNRRILREVLFAEAWADGQRIGFSHVTQVIESAAADREAAGLLHIPPRTPILRETAVFHDPDGTPAGLFITAYRADVFRFSATTQWTRDRTESDA